jgi:hypothetical protein
MIAAGLTAGMLNLNHQLDALRLTGAIFTVSPKSRDGVYVRNEYMKPDGQIDCDKIASAQINFATGGISHSNAAAIGPVLDGCGLSITQVQAVGLGAGDSAVALQNGAIAMSYLSTPFADQAYNSDYATLIPNTAYSFASYIQPTKLLTERPEVAAAMLRAIMRTHRTYLAPGYHDNADVVSQIAEFVGVEPDSVTAAEELVFPPDLAFLDSTVDAMSGVQDIWLKAGGILEYDQAIPIESIIDTSIAEEVAGGGGA